MDQPDIALEESKEDREAWDYLKRALYAAYRTGMLVEFVWTFGTARAAGDEVFPAVNEALSQWDIG